MHEIWKRRNFNAVSSEIPRQQRMALIGYAKDSANQVIDRLTPLKPYEAVEYYRGIPNLQKCEFAWELRQAADAGLILLVQHRYGEMDYGYWAAKKPQGEKRGPVATG